MTKSYSLDFVLWLDTCDIHDTDWIGGNKVRAVKCESLEQNMFHKLCLFYEGTVYSQPLLKLQGVGTCQGTDIRLANRQIRY